ncbi:Dipeptide transport ATP-binding protein dppF [Lachnospiraceae bacterium TWA4]|nr:Dipeptide transport ATP-binding protein dppF [Lachnospiraceae bacterium TWA4]
MMAQMAHQIAVMYLGNIVEVLPGENMKDIVSHPYTKALMGSVFEIDMDYTKPIESIDSEIPSPLDVPPGCPFQNRCEHCTSKCQTEKPELREIEPGHFVACHCL